MLVDGLRSYRSALSASLWATYGLRLSDALAGSVRASELADLTAELPAGCAFWQAVGGPLAWTPEMHLLARIEYAQRVTVWQSSGKGAKPKPSQPPPYAGQLRADEARMQEKAERWQARQEATRPR